MAMKSRPFALVRKLARIVFFVLFLMFIGFVGLVFAYRGADPVSTLVLTRRLLGEPVDQRFVPLARISPDLAAAVVTSEDAKFCRHHGVDWGSLREVVDNADEEGGFSRGASTITMQVAKNLFLWPSRSFIRKGLEIPIALVLDWAWPKRRILEIYLNIAEWGDGVFGAEAAARHYYRKSAADLDGREAVLLATALPNPAKRDAAHPGRLQLRLAGLLRARLRSEMAPLGCLDEKR